MFAIIPHCKLCVRNNKYVGKAEARGWTIPLLFLLQIHLANIGVCLKCNVNVLWLSLTGLITDRDDGPNKDPINIKMNL